MDSGHGHRHGGSPLWPAAHVTGHCLMGCMIGEVAGLAIGVWLGLHAIATIGLAIVLAYVSGFALALIPLMRGQGLDFMAALRVVWLGEAISIGVMEIVMNGVDYAIGGIQSGSLLAPLFWVGLGVGAVAGFIAAWPVNYLLLARELRDVH